MKPAKKYNPETKKPPVETDPWAFLEIDFDELDFNFSEKGCFNFEISPVDGFDVCDDLKIFDDLKI